MTLSLYHITFYSAMTKLEHFFKKYVPILSWCFVKLCHNLHLVPMYNKIQFQNSRRIPMKKNLKQFITLTLLLALITTITPIPVPTPGNPNPPIETQGDDDAHPEQNITNH